MEVGKEVCVHGGKGWRDRQRQKRDIDRSL